MNHCLEESAAWPGWERTFDPREIRKAIRRVGGSGGAVLARGGSYYVRVALCAAGAGAAGGAGRQD